MIKEIINVLPIKQVICYLIQFSVISSRNVKNTQLIKHINDHVLLYF